MTEELERLEKLALTVGRKEISLEILTVIEWIKVYNNIESLNKDQIFELKLLQLQYERLLKKLSHNNFT